MQLKQLPSVFYQQKIKNFRFLNFDSSRDAKSMVANPVPVQFLIPDRRAQLVSMAIIYAQYGFSSTSL